MSVNTSKYRDELIQTIKDMGQELIDRAESMVHEDCDMITNFNINIDIPQPMDGSPELTWSTSVLSKNFFSKEIGHSAGDAKMETHVETVTVEKKIKPRITYKERMRTDHPTVDSNFQLFACPGHYIHGGPVAEAPSCPGGKCVDCWDTEIPEKEH